MVLRDVRCWVVALSRNRLRTLQSDGCLLFNRIVTYIGPSDLRDSERNPKCHGGRRDGEYHTSSSMRGEESPGAVSALTACAEPSGYFRNVILMVSIKRS